MQSVRKRISWPACRAVATRSAVAWTLLVLPLSAGDCHHNKHEEPPRAQQIFVTVSGFMPLAPPAGFYELWLGSPAQAPPAGVDPWSVPQSYVSIVSFSVSEQGVAHSLAGADISTLAYPPGWSANSLARGLVTQQLPTDIGVPHDPGFPVASGAFVEPGYIISTTLTAQDSVVTKLDLSALAGAVTLATPTTVDPNDELLGAWFFQGDVSAPTASLELGPADALPQSQIFEGWLIERGLTGTVQNVLSMGRFRTANGPDSDGPGPAAGTLPGPPFPGQDFNAQLPTGLPFLSNPEIMITLEPEPDPQPSQPTTLRLLRLGIHSTTPSHVALPMDNSALAGTLPSMMITVQR